MSVRLSVNGTEVTVAPGATLLAACRAAGAAVPTLCTDDRLAPYGSCRVCLVAVEGGRGPLAACVTPATTGMRIRTDDPVTVATARHVLELMVSELPERALDLPVERSELVGVCGQLDVGPAAFGTAYPSVSRGFDFSHPYVKYDRDLCIACARCVRMCDEVQGTFALVLASRGAATVAAPGSGRSWAESDCVSCGGASVPARREPCPNPGSSTCDLSSGRRAPPAASVESAVSSRWRPGVMG